MKYMVTLLILLSVSGWSQSPGTVTVHSAPGNNWVRIDSMLVGKTPLEGFSLPAGRHVIQVYPPQSGIWNLEERIYHVRIQPHQDTTITVNFSTPVLVNSLPYNAVLFQDTTRLGSTPIYLPFEENLGRAFLLRKQGFKDYSFVLNSRKSILARLQHDERLADENEREKPQFLGMIGKRHLKSKFSLLALAAASHWASFYFKNRADSNFDRYERAADPVQRERFFDRTERFDTYSEISLGVSYVSLAGLIYMVIWR